METQDRDKMINLALEKQGLIESFLQLTQEQSEAIDNNHYDSILSIINKKQNIIEKVNLLDLNNQDIGWEAHQDLRPIDSHIKELMSQALALEKKNTLALKKQQAVIIEKLQNIKQNQLSHWAYQGKKHQPEGVLIDKKK